MKERVGEVIKRKVCPKKGGDDVDDAEDEDASKEKSIGSNR